MYFNGYILGKTHIKKGAFLVFEPPRKKLFKTKLPKPHIMSS